MKKLKEVQKDGLYVEQYTSPNFRVKKIEKVLKEKEELSEKLRREVG